MPQESQNKKKWVWVLVVGIFILASALIASYFLFWKEPEEKSTEDSLTPQEQPAEDPELVVVYGDSRTGHDAHAEVVEQIQKVEPDVIFHTGDLVGDGRKESDWEKFDEITSELLSGVEFYPAHGNHEKNADLYFDHFELPSNERWYSVDLGEMYAIVLDSTVDLDEGSEQYEWLEAELEKVEDSDFVISVFHHPPYSTGSHAEDEMDLRDSIVPLFETHDVEVVFNGHDHTYERSYVNGIYYIVTGGGGAPLYNQSRESEYSQKVVKDYHFCVLQKEENGYKMTVIDDEGKTIDEVLIE